MNSDQNKALALLAVLLLGALFVRPASFTVTPSGLLSEDQLRALQGPGPTVAPGTSPTAPGQTAGDLPIYWFGIKLPRWIPVLTFFALLAAVLLGWIGFMAFIYLIGALVAILALGMALSPVVAFMQLLTDVVRALRDVVNPGGPGSGGVVDKIAATLSATPWWVLLALLAALVIFAYVLHDQSSNTRTRKRKVRQ